MKSDRKLGKYRHHINNSIPITLLTVTLTLFGLVPAEAFLGLGACDKVKKQILKIEKKIDKEVDYWNSHIDEVMSQTMIARHDSFEKRKHPYRIWKTAYNNPKCFTRTQNIEIDRRSDYDAKYNLWGTISFRIQTNSYGSDCDGLPTYTIDLGKYGGKSKGCKIPARRVVQESRANQSIYAF